MPKRVNELKMTPVKPSRLLLGISAGIAIAVLLVGALLFRVDTASRQLADQSRILIFARAKMIKPGDVPSLTRFQRVLAYEPLNARLVSGALFIRSGAGRDRKRVGQGVAVLGKLGWRDTVAVQNRLFVAAENREIFRALDLVDSLLRRDQLTSEITPLMNAMETMPRARAEIVLRLKKNPPWRKSYLATVGGLKTEPLIEGRYRLLEALQAGSGKLDTDELAPSVARIANAGKIAEASALWRRHVGKPGGGSILLDGNFARFSATDFSEGTSVPFEWYTSTGAGFSVTPIEGAEGAVVEIRWDGRRAPVFLNQIVSAEPGNYRLVVRVAEAPSTAQDMLQFSADCMTGGRNIFRFVRTIDRQRLEYVSDGPIQCRDYRFSVRGFVAPRDLSEPRLRSVPVMPTARVTSLSELVLVPAR